MAQACPINSQMVDSNRVRLTALQISLLLVVCLILPNWYIPAFLALDFVLRGVVHKPGFLGLTAGWMASLLRLQPKRVNAAPKQFAAKIGLTFALILTVLGFLDQVTAYRVVGVMLLGACGLEAVFNFCLGCKIYPLWVRLVPGPASGA